MLILPLCYIYRHGGHDGWSAESSDIPFKGNPLRMIQAKFGLNWPSRCRGEDFWKSLQMDDGCQVMAIAHTGELKMGRYQHDDWILSLHTKINKLISPSTVKSCDGLSDHWLDEAMCMCIIFIPSTHN